MKWGSENSHRQASSGIGGQKDWASSGPIRGLKRYPHTSNRKECKVKDSVGGRDVKAEVLRERERKSVMGNIGVT